MTHSCRKIRSKHIDNNHLTNSLLALPPELKGAIAIRGLALVRLTFDEPLTEHPPNERMVLHNLYIGVFARVGPEDKIRLVDLLI